MCVLTFQIEQEERAKIDAIKEEEHKNAMEAIERWKENQRLQSNQEQESLKQSMTGSHEEPMSRNKEDDLPEMNADINVSEMQETNQKPAVKKQPSHNKQRTSGKLYFNVLV